jgi:hypothetical protein
MKAQCFVVVVAPYNTCLGRPLTLVSWQDCFVVPDYWHKRVKLRDIRMKYVVV